MSRIGTITCAVCKSEVDFASSYRDELRCGFVFAVMCHGAREEVFVSDDEARTVGALVANGTAFASAVALAEATR